MQLCDVETKRGERSDGELDLVRRAQDLLGKGEAADDRDVEVAVEDECNCQPFERCELDAATLPALSGPKKRPCLSRENVIQKPCVNAKHARGRAAGKAPQNILIIEENNISKHRTATSKECYVNSPTMCLSSAGADVVHNKVRLGATTAKRRFRSLQLAPNGLGARPTIHFAV